MTGFSGSSHDDDEYEYVLVSHDKPDEVYEDYDLALASCRVHKGEIVKSRLKKSLFVMTRPSFESIYMRLAMLMAERGTCARTNSKGDRMQVGCAIVSADFRSVFSVGYNGNACGLPNECDDQHRVGGCGCIHAEANAIVSCQADRHEPKFVFCTHLPCTACAKLIIQLGGVRRVFYHHEYRDTTGLTFLSSVGIEHAQISGSV